MVRKDIAVGSSVLLAACVAAWLLLPTRSEVSPSGGTPSARSSVEPIPVPATSEVVRAAVDVEAQGGETQAPSIARWVVQGFVHEGESPVSSAYVRLDLVRSRKPELLGEVETDSTGRFQVDATAVIGGVPEDTRSLATILVDVRSPGFKPGVAMERLEGRSSGPIELDVALQRGRAMRGRVVDADGVAVAGATVSLKHAEGKAKRSSTVADGSFDAWIAAHGPHVLHVAKFDVGVALMSGLELDPAAETVVGDLVLRGAGAIRGRAVLPSGDPVADLEIVAHSITLEGKLATEDVPEISDGLGLPFGKSNSDDEGRFSIGGLAPGRYWLTAKDAFAFEERGGAREHQPGDEGVELVVERYRLRVRVSDEAGAPFPFARLSVRSARKNRSAFVVEEDGTHDFFGRPDEEWQVEAAAPYFMPATSTHAFVLGRYDDRLELTLRQRGAERGSLRFELTTRSTVPLEGGRFFLLANGDHSESYSRELDANDRVDELVPGRFDLMLMPGERWIRGLVNSKWFFPVTDVVEIQANEETRVRVDARAGGRLRVPVRVPAGSAASLADATLVYVDASGQLETVRNMVRFDEGGRIDTRAAWAPNVPLVALLLLEPGVHTLRFSATGFHDLERDCTIRPGEYTDVEFALSSR